MNFLVDVQLSPYVARRLTELGHASAHVGDWMSERSLDTVIWQAAIERRYIMITKDVDYVALARRRGRTTPLVWLRIGNCPVPQVVTLLERSLPKIARDIAVGQKIIELR